jgi:transcriptional regulator with XRE-family HTH domain
VREAKKLSQRELAELSGVHYVTIANLESTPGAVPRANLETLTKLAAALAVSVAELLPRAKVGGGRRC